MDLPVQNLRGNSHGDDQTLRRSRAEGAFDTFSESEEDFFHLAPLGEVEEHLKRLLELTRKLSLLARKRRQAEQAEKCAICGNPWKHRLPDGGKVPVGLQLWHMPDGTTMNLYACDAACFSRLQYEVEKRTFQLRKDRDEQKAADHQKLVTLKRERRGLKL